MFTYILPIENFFGGNGWKMPVIFTTDVNLTELKKPDMNKYIKIMMLAFNKLFNELSYNNSFTSIQLVAEYSNSNLNPKFWEAGQAITTEHIGTDEALSINFTDSQGIAFTVKEPFQIQHPEMINQIFFNVLHRISLTESDLAVIIEDD
jgi:hypothetical protein